MRHTGILLFSVTTLEDQHNDVSLWFTKYTCSTFTLIIALPFLDTAILNSAFGQYESIAIFDGKSLEGWEGDHELWRVDNGVLVGGTTTPLEKTTYLIWRRGTVDDFELTLSYRITAGNRIQYRSQDPRRIPCHRIPG